MRQINYDNDEMIKRLKKNIKENERILFERTSNIEKIKRDLRNQNIGENEKSNKDNFNKEPSKDTFGSKSSFSILILMKRNIINKMRSIIILQKKIVHFGFRLINLMN